MLMGGRKSRWVAGRAARMLAGVRFSRRPAAVVAAVAIAAAIVGTAGFWAGMHARDLRGPVEAKVPARAAVRVSVACDGWTRSNADLGVFASGIGPGGVRADEHMVFEGPGSQTVELAAGAYEFSLQAPQIMLEDGTVLAAGDPVGAWLLEGEGASVEVAYAQTDLHGMVDEELEEIAQASFDDPEAATAALEEAKAGRDAAPDPNVPAPDDREGDAPVEGGFGPLSTEGGEDGIR